MFRTWRCVALLLAFHPAAGVAPVIYLSRSRRLLGVLPLPTTSVFTRVFDALWGEG